MIQEFKVYAWNEYSVKRKESRLVIAHTVGADSVTDALDQAAVLAAQWNGEVEQENMRVNLMTCNGFVRAV